MPPTQPLPRVDPTAPGFWSRLYAPILRTKPGRWASINLSPKIDPWLLRASGGRLTSGVAMPTALLTTTGAKSGATRVNPVFYFHDGDAVVVIASSYGRDSHPGWYHNIRKDPHVAIAKSGDGTPMLAHEVADLAERDRLWALADRVWPLFADYRDRAKTAGRTIPIIRLTPA
ncbi:MAG: nitroreductase/quinone reductase family protein [Segniliparus sp.]|uniref:nitroreductase/quinone reductase family protein n=1 Tax=Segniliparus sp. TaxID=2804064 RepID=UPI003F2AA154